MVDGGATIWYSTEYFLCILQYFPVFILSLKPNLDGSLPRQFSSAMEMTKGEAGMISLQLTLQRAS